MCSPLRERRYSNSNYSRTETIIMFGVQDIMIFGYFLITLAIFYTKTPENREFLRCQSSKKISRRRSGKSFESILRVFRLIYDCSAGFPAAFIPLFIPPAFPFSRYLSSALPDRGRPQDGKANPCNQYRQKQRLKSQGIITKKEDASGASRLITKGAPPLYL